MTERPQEYKTIPAFSNVEDEKKGIVTHYVAVMGNVDMSGDVIHPGAFSKTLAERGNKLRVIDQHNLDSVLRVIGRPLDAREVGRADLPSKLLAQYPEATGALKMQTQYLLDTPEGSGTFKRIAAGAIDEYSIGYDAIVYDHEKRLIGGEEKTIRNLRELKLWEYGPVIFGMNPATMTLDIKGQDKAAWTASYINDLPDASFLYIESGGEKDDDGKTTPRALRHFPYRDADGAIDLPHLRNAIARIPQSNAPGLDDAAKERLQARARRLLEDAQGDEKAGRRMRGDKNALLKQIRVLLDELERWADYADNEEEPPAEEEPEKTAPPDGGRIEDAKATQAGPVSPPTLQRERERLMLQIQVLEVE